MLSIDGSFGEGGGQIIRTSLALSLVTGKAFRVYNVRAGRAKPGLQPQHLTAVRAAAEVGRAQVDGAAVGGRFSVYVEPGTELRRLDLVERGVVLSERARALCVNLRPDIGERELKVVAEQMGLPLDQLQLDASDNAFSPDNVLTVEI